MDKQAIKKNGDKINKLLTEKLDKDSYFELYKLLTERYNLTVKHLDTNMFASGYNIAVYDLMLIMTQEAKQ